LAGLKVVPLQSVGQAGECLGVFPEEGRARCSSPSFLCKFAMKMKMELKKATFSTSLK